MKNKLHKLSQQVYDQCTLVLKKFFVGTSTMPVKNPVLAKNVQILESRVQGAIRFLKKTSISKNGKRIKLHRFPWYLVIGSVGSGKTTLLANSNVNFILDKPSQRTNIKAIPYSETCDWWVTREVVLIDVPGSYVSIRGNQVTLPNKLWRGFLTLIKKLRGRQGVSGIVIVLSLSELMDREERQHLIHLLKRRTIELVGIFGNDLPFYFAITKCDLIPGFSDFFSDCGSDELAQAWGITFPSQTEAYALVDVFAHRFDALISRLNKQLIWRLHHERNPYAKVYIKDFPLHVERLGEALTEVLKALTDEKNRFFLKSIFLTSAIQNAYPPQTAAHPKIVPADEFQQVLEIMQNPVVSKQAYFVKQFILHGLLPRNTEFSN